MALDAMSEKLLEIDASDAKRGGGGVGSELMTKLVEVLKVRYPRHLYLFLTKKRCGP